jgi:hypothetical protein
MARVLGSLLEGTCARMPWYTDLKTVFEVLGGRECEFDWLITELECNCLPPELQDGDAWLFAGDVLSDLVRRQDPPLQFLRGVLTGFDRATPVDWNRARHRAECRWAASPGRVISTCSRGTEPEIHDE